jgi:hypothetical protein
MSWMMMLFSLLILPLLQPLTDYGSDKLQKTLGVKQVHQQVQQPQPYTVYHNGQWWKFENNQWYVWQENRNARN